MSIVYLQGKVSDMCSIEFEGTEHFGYVPRIEAIGGGDYINMKIDNDTGKIIGWEPIGVDDLQS